MTIFFTSDTHLGHANIIKYCHRPFSSVEEMDGTIIKNWNSVVSEQDLVYHLGDFAFRQHHSYRKQLNGEIIFIEGNHDKVTGPGLFKEVHKLLRIKINEYDITLCHFAMRVWNKSHFNSWHLYGHSHGGLPPEGKSWDVGVDNNNFTPLSLDQVVEIMKGRPDNFNLVKSMERHEVSL
jgi:calcineurin-like phosphoesterase family protein